jgi:hypothetical protein
VLVSATAGAFAVLPSTATGHVVLNRADSTTKAGKEFGQFHGGVALARSLGAMDSGQAEFIQLSRNGYL